MRTMIGITGALALAVPLWPVAPAAAISNDVVISQVYGGGGSAAPTYRNDYVELFNRGSSVVSLTGMTLQYASAAGTGLFSANVTALSGNLQPGQYFLVQQASGATGAVLPTPDATGTTAMSATDGKVALVNAATGLGCNGGSTPCNPGQLALIKDLVGYGAANFYEGTAAPRPSATTALIRNSAGCTETDTNGSDFTATTPNPRNTATAVNSCNAPDTAPAVSATVPANGAAHPMDLDLGVTFSEAVNVAEPWFTLTCSSQPIAVTVSGGPQAFVLTPATDLPTGGTCDLTVLAAQVTDQDTSDPPDAMASDYTASFTPYDPCQALDTTISLIQGNGPTAAITGHVFTKGVVTADLEGTARLGGFYLQDPVGDADPATSEGIFVYTGSADTVSVGQQVRVTGYARERYGQTTLNSADSNTAAVSAASIRVCGTGTVPTPTPVTMPLTDPERYEGMRVSFGQSLQVADSSDYGRYGEVTLALPLPGEARLFTGTQVEEPGAAAVAREQANAQRRIILDDTYSAQNPATLFHPNGNPYSLLNSFRLGDTLTGAVGVLGYDYSAYRLYPTGPATYASAGPRPTTPTIDGLRIATLNAGNFFLTGNSGAAVCGPDQDQLCRGWDTSQPEEFTRQRIKLLAALSGLNADVIAVNEVENTAGVSPLADLVTDLPGYAYIDTGVVGTDVIRNGVLYRTAAVTPVGAVKVLDQVGSRPSPAQTFRDTRGEVVTVVVNHFRSKGSPCAGDPDLGDGQGECNLTRTTAAEALVDWLATDPTGSGDPDVLVMGDFNAYMREDPIQAIRAGADDQVGTSDDFEALDAAQQWSYVFDGQAGSLDHAFVSASLLPAKSGAAFWHINADEPGVLGYDLTFKPPAQQALYEPNAFRSSDHDPLIVGLVWPVVEPPVTPDPPVTPTPVVTPAPVKSAQSLRPLPKRIKKRGLTVLAPADLRTSAGQPVTTVVTGKARKGKVRYFRIVKGKDGKVSVRTFGRVVPRLVVVRTATGTDAVEAYRSTTVFRTGLRAA